MDARPILRLALALMALALPAAAQTPAATRAGEAHDARAAKAKTVSPFTPGAVERWVTRLETGAFKAAFAGRDGLGVRVGGIRNGSGFAFGPSWRTSRLFDGRLQVNASGAASIAMDHEVAAGAAIPNLGTPRLSVTFDAAATHLGQERFFGTGMASAPSDVTAFALNTRRLTARASYTPVDRLHVSVAAGTLGAAAGDGKARLVPAISTRFTGREAVGLGLNAAFTVLSLDATVDSRDQPGNPRRGGRYVAAVERYADSSLQRHSFTRVNAEVEQHLSAWKRQRLLTLRATASASFADRGHEVPFYLQPTLGGSRLLRGFVTDRFRDRQLLALQAEYGWDLSPFLNAVVFYETGAVAARWRDMTARTFRRDYGIGFRFGSARTVMLRTDVALGSGEGTRLTMRFNHAF